MIGALLAALLFTSSPASGGPAAPSVRLDAASILVVPFESAPRDGRAYWLGEAVALLLTDDINARGFGGITRPIRERAYELFLARGCAEGHSAEAVEQLRRQCGRVVRP